MNKANLYSSSGIKKGQITLPKEFGEKILTSSMKTLAQAIRVYEDRSHTKDAKVKTRAEIVRTKKKWYRQKGTGGARHGARSAPIFVGGGVAHGPKGVKRTLTLSSNMRKKALKIALSIKSSNGEIFAVDGLSVIKKTKEANKLLNKILTSSDRKVSRVTLVLANGEKENRRAFKNLKTAKILEFRNLNARNVFLGGILIFDRKIFSLGEGKSKAKVTKKKTEKLQKKTVKPKKK